MANLDISSSEMESFEGRGSSDSLARDLENLVKEILRSTEKQESIRDLYNYLHKHQLDIESVCKKNGWEPGGGKDFLHSLERSIVFSHEYITNFPKQTKQDLFELIVESTEEVLFFLINES